MPDVTKSYEALEFGHSKFSSRQKSDVSEYPILLFDNGLGQEILF